MSINDAAVQALPEAARLLVDAMVTKAPTQKIKEAISVGDVVNDGEGIYHIDVKVDLVKAPEGRAYEYGSGLHNPLKSDTYPINPVKGMFLAFYWEKLGKRVVLPHVNHPGVAARPYIKPSIEENKTQMRQIIGRAFSIEVKTLLGEMLKVD
jgi:hypothetical protein